MQKKPIIQLHNYFLLKTFQLIIVWYILNVLHCDNFVGNFHKLISCIDSKFYRRNNFYSCFAFSKIEGKSLYFFVGEYCCTCQCLVVECWVFIAAIWKFIVTNVWKFYLQFVCVLIKFEAGFSFFAYPRSKCILSGWHLFCLIDITFVR